MDGFTRSDSERTIYSEQFDRLKWSDIIADQMTHNEMIERQQRRISQRPPTFTGFGTTEFTGNSSIVKKKM